MPEPKEKALTYEMAIAEILRSVAGPMPAQELAAQLLAALPSAARNPQKAMRQHIRQANGRQLVFLDMDTVLPLRLAYQGARFRIPLDREIINKGLLSLYESLWSYLPPYFPVEQVRLVDASGRDIAYRTQSITKKVRSLFGEADETYSYANLRDWFRAQKMYFKDHLLVTILDWEQGVFQLEREPLGQRNQVLLAERNRLLADLFYELLESAVDESIQVHTAVPTVYTRLPDKGGYSGGHWRDVLEADGRMSTNGWAIYYQDSGGPLIERLARETRGERLIAASAPIDKEQQQQVYRFKAILAGRPKIWREIEIQGRQTLADLDLALRAAFHHDTFDHMGGFWKLTPRSVQAKTGAKRGGRQPRYRQVELGTVNPMGGGDGAKIKIAGVGLALGDQLKYVYDFGDWIEHYLTLQVIEAPQSGVNYPREAARNQLVNVYCVACQQQGKQMVAKWICLQCSSESGQEVWLCEKCIRKHEEHYLEEIIY